MAVSTTQLRYALFITTMLTFVYLASLDWEVFRIGSRRLNSEKRIVKGDRHVLPKTFYRTEHDPDDWQPVIERECYVYSAFLAPESINHTSTVWLLGTLIKDRLVKSRQPRLHCVLLMWQADGLAAVLTAPVDRIRKIDIVRRFGEIQFGCKLAEKRERLLNATISLITEQELASLPRDWTEIPYKMKNIMRLHDSLQTVHTRADGSGSRLQFVVCLWQPLFGDIIEPDWFVEWMEYNMLFGADIIQVYGSEIAGRLLPYIRHYQRRRVLYLLPWTLPDLGDFSNYKQIHARFQETMIRDCQLRYGHRSKYIVGVDVDELIVPRRPGDLTWSAMIQNSSCPPTTITYGAKHVYFGADINRASRQASQLISLSRTNRSVNVLPYGTRSKYIAIGSKVKLMLTHFTVMQTEDLCVLPTTVGGLHHYRLVGSLLHHVGHKTQKDLIMSKYRALISHKVARTLGEIGL